MFVLIYDLLACPPNRYVLIYNLVSGFVIILQCIIQKLCTEIYVLWNEKVYTIQIETSFNQIVCEQEYFEPQKVFP